MSKNKKVSERTKQCQRRKHLFAFLHFLCMFGPLLYFIPLGYATGETTTKVTMSLTIVISIVLAFISLVVDVRSKQGLHKSIMWVLIAGVLFALQEVKVFIWIMCITSVLDELVFVKLKDYYKACLISNREIDRRG